MTRAMMEDLDETPHAITAPQDPLAEAPVGPRAPVTARDWVSPGVSVRKRILTGVGVALVAA
ncbi:MAG: hypothetical protein ACRDID_01295, partial [Ktedonobacterales bacterium]